MLESVAHAVHISREVEMLSPLLGRKLDNSGYIWGKADHSGEKAQTFEQPYHVRCNDGNSGMRWS